MKLQKKLTMKKEGQLEFDAPKHKGTPRPLSKNRNPDISKVDKKRPVILQNYGLEVNDSGTLFEYVEGT